MRWRFVHVSAIYQASNMRGYLRVSGLDTAPPKSAFGTWFGAYSSGQYALSAVHTLYDRKIKQLKNSHP